MKLKHCCPYCGENEFTLEGEDTIVFCSPCGMIVVGYDGDEFTLEGEAGMYAEAERRIGEMWIVKRMESLRMTADEKSKELELVLQYRDSCIDEFKSRLRMTAAENKAWKRKVAGVSSVADEQTILDYIARVPEVLK